MDTQEWLRSAIKASQTYIPPNTTDKSRPRLLPYTEWKHPVTPGTTRFVCISDTHGFHDNLYAWRKKENLPIADVFIHTGDFTTHGMPEEVLKFNSWLGTLPYKHRIVVAGNHDTCLDSEWCKNAEQEHVSGRSLLNNCVYLEDDFCMADTHKIYGSPYTPVCKDWAFKLQPGANSELKWANIPTDTDVLLTHTPPLGRLDRTTSHQYLGCPHLLRAVQERIRPSAHIFGHIHNAHGVSYDGITHYINSCVCTYDYNPVRSPIVFELPRK